jgi:hypothetical protein
VTTYSAKETINCPPDDVWELLTDAADYGEWNTTTVSLEGQIELGSRIKLVSTVNPKRAFKLSVSEMDRPHRMVWSDGMPFGLFRGVRTFTLTPRGERQTEFEMVEVFSGFLEPLISKSIPDMTDSFAEFSKSLKVAAESGN